MPDPVMFRPDGTGTLNLFYENDGLPLVHQPREVMPHSRFQPPSVPQKQDENLAKERRNRPDRRKSQRRQHVLPCLLDTRSRHERRKPDRRRTTSKNGQSNSDEYNKHIGIYTVA